MKAEADRLFTDKSFGFLIKNDVQWLYYNYFCFLSCKFVYDVAH